MKSLINLLLVTILVPLFSQAQSNYKPGYVVTFKGDTLRGFINYREWNTNPTSIVFKKNVADRESQKLTPDDIVVFNINDLESYQRFAGKIGTDPIDANRITMGKDTTFKMIAVFLKVLTKGKNLALLSYTDEVRMHFYIEEAPAYAPVELSYSIYKVDDTRAGTIKTVVENGYARQLYALAQKYNQLTDELTADLNHLKYYSDDILKVVDKINGSTTANNPPKATKYKKTIFFAGVGINFASTKPIDGFDVIGATSDKSVLPMLTGGFNLLLNPNIGKAMFRVEASLTGIKYRTNYDMTVFPRSNVIYKYSTIAAALTPQFIYNFYNADDFKFFAGAGLSFAIYKYINSSYADKDGKPVVGNSANPYDFVTFNTPVMFKAGVLINRKIEIYINYIQSSPVSHDEIFRLSFTSIQGGINYYFK